MNILQHISEKEYGPVLLTLNPPFEPRKETVVARYQYEHPIIDANAWAGQRALPSIQNTRGISYAGAWTACGFHEDGFRSGLLAATSNPLSTRLPFDIQFPGRENGALWAAYLFDCVEYTGLRRIGAFFMGSLLHVIRVLLCM